MTILNKSKIRPDVLRQIETYMRIQKQVIKEFFKKEENKNVDFQALWQKVMIGNEQFFEGKDMRSYLTEREQLYLARYHRYATEEAANYIQKKVSIFQRYKN